MRPSQRLSKKIRIAKALIGQRLVGGLAQAGREFVLTGKLPDCELHRVWLLWLDASQRVRSLSVPPSDDLDDVDRQRQAAIAEAGRWRARYLEILHGYGVQA